MNHISISCLVLTQLTIVQLLHVHTATVNQIPVKSTTSKQQILKAASPSSACLTNVLLLKLHHHAKFALKPGDTVVHACIVQS